MTHPDRQSCIRQAGTKGAVLLLIALTLAACESSTRLGSLLPGSGITRPQAAVPQAAPPPLAPAPNTDVDTAELPPPPGAGAVATAPQTTLPQSPSPATPAPVAPTSPAPAPTAPQVTPGVGSAPGNLPAQPPQVATAPAQAAAPTRTALTGGWSLTESAGARCRLTLSSAPKLDLYGAGTSGCQAKELQRVNAWELAGSEVILYEPGGAVVARLRASGAGTYSGVSTRSGAPIAMTK